MGNWGDNCSLLHLSKLKTRTIGFIFFKKSVDSFNQRCKCLYYILMKLPLINIVVYLCLSSKCFNRGRLIWNSNASPTWFLTRKYDIDVFTLCQKEGCVSILAHNQFWRSMVYRRIMTAASLLRYLQWYCENSWASGRLLSSWTPYQGFALDPLGTLSGQFKMVQLRPCRRTGDGQQVIRKFGSGELKTLCSLYSNHDEQMHHVRPFQS